MLKYLILFVLIIISFTSFSQTKEDALRDAKITADATLKEDFKTVLDHTLPSVLELMGGKEKALELVKTSYNMIKKQGFTFEKSDVIMVSDIVKEQGQYRCYVENLNHIKMSGMRVKSKSFLLGIFDDKDKKWWFIEAEKMNNEKILAQILPDFKTSLEIPKDEVTTEKI